VAIRIDVAGDMAKDDVSHSEPTRSLGNTYRNTSGKIRIVTIQIHSATDSAGYIWVYCDSSPSPTTKIGVIGVGIEETGGMYPPYQAITFVVPPNYYYKAVADDYPVLDDWHEWDLH